MTLPHERMNALRNTRQFLVALLNPQETPRVPRSVRRWASTCLKHFPMQHELETLAKHPLLKSKPRPPCSDD